MPVYNIIKSVLGNFNQGNERFGHTAGTQCACNALFSIFWSNIRSVSCWTTNDLDKILIEGDRIYKSLNTQGYLSAEDRPTHIEISEIISRVNLLDLYTGEANLVEGHPFLTIPFNRFGNNNFNTCLMFINSYTLAIFKFDSRDICYLFDSHSRDGRGLSVRDGKSVCLKFENLNQLEAYIQVIYLEFSKKSPLVI